MFLYVLQNKLIVKGRIRNKGAEESVDINPPDVNSQSPGLIAISEEVFELPPQGFAFRFLADKSCARRRLSGRIRDR